VSLNACSTVLNITCDQQKRTVTTIPGKSWNLVRPFPGLESHGKQPRSWKVMEDDHDVLDFCVKMH